MRILKNEIDKSQNELLGVRMDLRKQSARLKSQSARMTETQKRRKRALAEQRKQMVNDVTIEKQQWNVIIRLAEKKMSSSLKQLQKERMMWQVLSQEAELRCDDGQTLVQTQVDKAIRKERELKSYISELREIHAIQTCLLLPMTRRIFSLVEPKPYCQYPRRYNKAVGVTTTKRFLIFVIFFCCFCF